MIFHVRHLRPVMIALLSTGIYSGAAVAQNSEAPSGLGRFFTTPGTRAELNDARENYTVNRPPPTPGGRPAEQPSLPQQVKLNGLIIRGDGSGQVWINDSSNTENTAFVESVSIDASRPGRPRVAVTLPGGKRIDLRPGEVFSLESGKVRDGFQKEGKQPEEVADTDQPGVVTESQQAEADKISELEKFDESELVDRDFRILLLEKRLEKLESAVTADETEESIQTESQRN